jgi:3-hydroxyacyl-[acyl-carrier-protein] dehydratase
MLRDLSLIINFNTETKIALTSSVKYLKTCFPGESSISEKIYFRFGKLKCKMINDKGLEVLQEVQLQE